MNNLSKVIEALAAKEEVKKVLEHIHAHEKETLDEQLVSWDPETDYLLEKCTAAYHDEKHEFSIIYGDYYFLEAILKLTGKELFIW